MEQAPTSFRFPYHPDTSFGIQDLQQTGSSCPALVLEAWVAEAIALTKPYYGLSSGEKWSQEAKLFPRPELVMDNDVQPISITCLPVVKTKYVLSIF